MELFLLSFFSSGFLASYLFEKGIVKNFNIEQYGLFGMTIFMAFLGYLIVKFKAFNIKMLAAQALVVSLVVLIGSMFAFVETTTSKILVGVTLALSAGMGWLLVKSVKLEVQRKEELQYMSDRLAVANDQLRKLDNAKSEFISIASHQLRTPLTAVKGFISLILEGAYGKVENKIRDALNKVYVSNERLIQLVENLLNVSRIESGRLEFKFEKARIENIIRELGDSFILIARAKGLYLDIKLPSDPLPEIEMDGPKIREVLSNLIDNAIKYTNRGGVTVRAELATGSMEQETGGTGYIPNLAPGITIEGSSSDNQSPQTISPELVRVVISDTGIGIPEKELPYLFSRFSRGKDTSRLHVGGTGLGLYVGKNMVEAHHGRVWTESDGLNKGSRFIVELPISQDKYQPKSE
ncbi:MAG: HAMP domain-containing sensor histidine kinase [Candidatus Moranbacteria bacterium]|nr:HAMP domain-containing sensor histidine kinase [Candidatus Moranbacteria bacterium]